jgi:hypothetical protein
VTLNRIGGICSKDALRKVLGALVEVGLQQEFVEVGQQRIPEALENVSLN